MPPPPFTLFAVCVPGLERVTLQEIQSLNLPPRLFPDGSLETGGITFSGSMEDLYRANLHLRTPSRILVRFGDFMATAFWELHKKAAQLPWEKFIPPGQPVALRVTCHHSRLYHSDGVAERIVKAIGDRLGKVSPLAEHDETAETQQPQLIIVRLDNNHVTISIDSSGDQLHRRGYKQAVAKAPLRENLAAAMLMASGWNTQSPLIDPFCGSGTIPIEAAMLAAGLAPGLHRSFSFMKWPGFIGKTWNRLLEEAQAKITPPAAPILASDRDAGAIQMAKVNAERAGVLPWIQFDQQAVSAIHPPAGPGWVVTNPPYGVRVSSNSDLRDLYAQFGKVLRLACPQWQVAILCSDPLLLGHTHLKLDTATRFSNGGINVHLGLGKVV
ncbi:MAG TPA: class I SAM-dependent RNA methyltransferase [Anaerolineaceae bacterium]|nr:class I SAM-dependent RNA methyltransferase [Anaerolineaceae bacterium]HPN51125.1 class I SAM-dependent RNA methyltransferase [Anaerolineaceae bacterium]